MVAIKFTSYSVFSLFASAYAGLLKVPISPRLISEVLDPVLELSGLEEKPKAPLSNAVIKVVTSVQAGADQMFNDVLIDTGSAILWVGGKDPYLPGANTQSLNATFGVGYAVGSVSGTAYRDRVTIGEASTHGQIIGSANVTNGFALVKPIDGILGLGPPGGNYGDVSGPFANKSTPTFIETLLAEKKIDHALFGVYVAPLGVDGMPEGTGELTFGGIDTTRIKEDIVWIPQNEPVNFHFEFNVTGFSFGSVALSVPAPARTDTGVLGILIPFDSLFQIRDVFHGTLSSSATLGVILSFPSNATSTLPDLSFTLGRQTVFSIPASHYLIPQSLYARLNLTDANGLVHTWISSAGPGSYLLGQKWLENAYSAYDLENKRVGFAHLA